tara:strand:- start:580 stop:831 length:252 start_codon:yes stop_codon:yes gene_type:complete
MKVKFKDVMCMGNQTYTTGEVGEFTDITGQQLVDKGYAEAADDKDDEKKAADDAKAKAAAEKEAAEKAKKEAKAKEAAENKDK